jgi:hypothetical protein
MSPRRDFDNRFDNAEGTVQVPEQRGRPAAVQEAAAAPGTAVPAARGDQTRWGPVWAGALVVLPTFLVLQFLFFALGWLDLAVEGAAAPATRGIVSAILGIIAFFVGGLLAASASARRGMIDGALHGTLVWALGVVGLIGLALAGGTSLLGPLAEVAGQLRVPDIPMEAVVATARQSAGWAALGLGVYLGSAVLGGIAGARMGPRGERR